MAQIIHGSLTANTVKTESLDAHSGLVAVLNKSTSATIYFRLGGTNPTVAGANTYTVLPGARRSVSATGDAANTNTVKLIAAGAADYEIEAS